ncbi:MAG TPA: penicillin-binding transpeptidase domain-containing protein [Phycisphaerae bacterium]|nr:penicillin-binding transpeptidase domain-containing protein [Phycisphaerae bacterium]HNU44974.1 penicillin-binding transpeptidase domain-containing protein [Phycisphaerae bacterium]
MFERRINWALGVLGVAALLIVARLGQLQLVRGAEYRRAAEALLRSEPQVLPFVRGRILDRHGQVLVADEPAWEVRVDYPALAPAARQTETDLTQLIRLGQRAGRYSTTAGRSELEDTVRTDWVRMWMELARFAHDVGDRGEDGEPVTISTLHARAAEIVARTDRIRAAVALRRGFDAEVAEERQAHPLITGLDAQRQIRAREVFAAYPWVHVTNSAERRARGDLTPLAHLLGRLGRVDADDIAKDPEADDPLASYRATESCGRTGVEAAAERRLRGRRGQLITDRDGRILEEIPPEDGQEVTLTLHTALQYRLYKLLGEAVERGRYPSGGTAVVLDVPTREVLALVSYPAYDPRVFQERYAELRDETARLPLRFRAVATQYPPGSIIKPLVCLAGLQRGAITLESTEECTGYLFPELQDRWRCWEVRGTGQRMAHGHVNVVAALTQSCNVFMYRLGERLGVGALSDTFDMVGIGRATGIGLREEVAGINPSPGYLVNVKGSGVYPAHGRLFAIGQGELSMTPVQVANLVAVYAGGKLRPVTLVRGDADTPVWDLPFAAAHWHAIREALFAVVNHRDGTAYKYARFEHPSYALCGKTGSATANPWPTAYSVPYVDAEGRRQVAVVRAGARRAAEELFQHQYPEARCDPEAITVAETFPPATGTDESGEDRFAHAWFAGYLQALDTAGEPRWSVPPRIAFVVLIEFGGSGGQVAGPLARQVAGLLLEVLGPDLNPDGLVVPEVQP